jgi:hypothetical protein
MTLCSLARAYILEENISIFRVEEYAKQETSMKQAASRVLFAACSQLTFIGLHGVYSRR